MAAIHVEKKDNRFDSDIDSNDDNSLSDNDDPNQRVSSDAEGEDSSGDDHHSSEDDAPSKSGMANMIAKILAKDTSSSNKALLAKGKTNRQILKDISKRRKEREEKEGTADKEDDEETPHIPDKELIRIEKRKLWESMARRKPSQMDVPRESKLRRIATQGMVQLFQSVHEHQKMLNQKIASVGPSERKKDKVVAEFTKGKFLDLLKGKKSAGNQNKEKENDSSSNSNPKWKILQDDFMMGARMKDWDKDDDESHEDSDNID